MRWVEDALSDLRHVGRKSRRRPGFTALALVGYRLPDRYFDDTDRAGASRVASVDPMGTLRSE